MMRTLSLLIAMWALGVGLIFAQETAAKSVLRLKNGDTLIGQVVLRTEQLLLFTAEDGKRYQFPAADVESIAVLQPEDGTVQRRSRRFPAALVESAGGVAYISAEAVGVVPYAAASVACGVRGVSGVAAFAGVGVGLEALVGTRGERRAPAFLPLFVQVLAPVSDNTVSLFFGLKAGYAFALQREFGGGAYLNPAGGFVFRMGGKCVLSVGLNGKIQSVAGTVIERNELGKFSVRGATPLYGAGIAVGLLF